MNFGLPSYDTVLTNATASFMRLRSLCNNHIVTKLQQLNFLDVSLASSLREFL